MKAVKIILITFVVVFGLVFIGAYIFIKTFDANKYRPQIVSEMTKALGRQVAIDNLKLTLSLSDGIALNIQGMSIEEDQNFADHKSFASVGSIYLHVNVMAYVQKHEIVVTKVTVDSPEINLVKNEQGQFNYESIVTHMAKKEEGAVTDSTTTPTPAQTEQKSQSAALPALTVQDIELKNGTIVYDDRMEATKMRVPVNQLDVSIANFSLTNAFGVKTNAAIFSGKQNIHVNGTVQLDIAKQMATINGFNVKTDLSELSVDQLKAAIASLAPLNIEGGMKGQVSIQIEKAVAGSAGLTTLASHVTLNNGYIKLKELFSPVSNMNATMDIDEKDATLKEFVSTFGSGKISLSGALKNYLTSQEPAFTLTLDNIHAGELLDPKMIPVKIEGNIVGKMGGWAQGITPDKLKTSLNGEGEFAVQEGRIVDLNILKVVIDQITNFTAMVGINAQNLEERLPENLKEKLKVKDTEIDQCQVIIKMKQGAIDLNNINVESSGLLVNLNGFLDFDQNLTLAGDVRLNQDLAGAIISANPSLDVLLNENKEIRIPLTPYQGKLAQVRMMPDFKDFSKTAVVNEGKQQLRKVIFKGLGIEDESQQAPDQNNTTQPTQPQQQPAQEEKGSTEKELINGLLNNIFK
jgi:hypothetical protein